MKSLLLIGATGLVGKNCLEQLLSHKWVGMVTVLSRRPIDIKHKKLVCEIVDFDQIEKYKRRIKADVMISAFGTTIKQAGHDQELFYTWEVDYPLNTAKIAYANGCRHFIFVSSIGAKDTSRNFYLKCKGQMETQAAQIGFDAVDIFQPSFLKGRRESSRPGEALFEKILGGIAFIFTGPFKKYTPIEASDVAQAIVKKAESSGNGVFRYTWSDMQKILGREPVR